MNRGMEGPNRAASTALLAFKGLAVSLILTAGAAEAQEFYVGEPVEMSGMRIVPNYLTDVRLDRDTSRSATRRADPIGPGAGVRAKKDQRHGFAPDSRIPYFLSITGCQGRNLVCPQRMVPCRGDEERHSLCGHSQHGRRGNLSLDFGHQSALLEEPLARCRRNHRRPGMVVAIFPELDFHIPQQAPMRFSL